MKPFLLFAKQRRVGIVCKVVAWLIVGMSLIFLFCHNQLWHYYSQLFADVDKLAPNQFTQYLDSLYIRTSSVIFNFASMLFYAFALFALGTFLETQAIRLGEEQATQGESQVAADGTSIEGLPISEEAFSLSQPE